MEKRKSEGGGSVGPHGVKREKQRGERMAGSASAFEPETCPPRRYRRVQREKKRERHLSALTLSTLVMAVAIGRFPIGVAVRSEKAHPAIPRRLHNTVISYISLLPD